MLEEIRLTNPVRVSIPASVASDLGNFKKAVGSILDKLGCAACCSGHDIHFDLHRDFAFRDLNSAATPLSTTPRRETLVEQKINRVGMQPAAATEIENVFTAIDRIAAFAGCSACCSGHDLKFHLERNFVLDESLNIEEPVLRFG